MTYNNYFLTLRAVAVFWVNYPFKNLGCDDETIAIKNLKLLCRLIQLLHDQYNKLKSVLNEN